MTTTVNADRGEVGLKLGERVFPMLPTMDACNAIEAQIGSVVWLWLRFTRREYFPTFHELAIIATECIRAAGRDRKELMLEKVSTEGVEKLIFAEGLLVTDPMIEVLQAMCTGGAKKKDAAGESPSPSAPTDSPTGS